MILITQNVVVATQKQAAYRMKTEKCFAWSVRYTANAKIVRTCVRLKGMFTVLIALSTICPLIRMVRVIADNAKISRSVAIGWIALVGQEI